MSIYPGTTAPNFQSGFRLFTGEQMNSLSNAINSSNIWPGRFFYLDPSASVQGNGTRQAPFNTLAAAYAATTDGQNDVVLLVGNGATSASVRLTSTFTWAKNATHLVGITAPTHIAQRARITTATTQTTNINPLFNITGSGCIFQNFSFFQGVGQSATDEQLITIGGDRNWFQNVHFGGMGHANGAARAGSYVIGLNGGDENLFQECAIGLDTVARSAANASVKLVAASQRNEFVDCLFPMYPTANSPLFVDASLSGGLNGSEMWFRRCTFTGLLAATSGTQPAVTVTSNTTLNGNIYFDGCTTVAAKWAVAATGSTTVKVMSYATAATTGFNSGVFASAADS